MIWATLRIAAMSSVTRMRSGRSFKNSFADADGTCDGRAELAAGWTLLSLAASWAPWSGRYGQVNQNTLPCWPSARFRTPHAPPSASIRLLSEYKPNLQRERGGGAFVAWG